MLSCETTTAKNTAGLSSFDLTYPVVLQFPGRECRDTDQEDASRFKHLAVLIGTSQAG